MEHEHERLRFSEVEYRHVPGLKPEMPEAEAQLALGAVTEKLKNLREEIELIGADSCSSCRGLAQELQGLQAVLGMTRLQLARVLDPGVPLEVLAAADSEFVQAQLLRELQDHRS